MTASSPFPNLDPLEPAPVVWPPREPLPPLTEPVPTIPAQYLPEPLRPWLMDTTDRMCVPPEFVAAPALVALSSVVGRQCAICPMAKNDWLEVPNLWGGIVGSPGLMKSAAIAEATRPMQLLVREAVETFQRLKRSRAVTLEVLKARRETVREEMKKAAKAKEMLKLAMLQEELEKLATEEALGEVTERRFSTSDATIEKIGELLNVNPNGLLYLRDELVGFLRGLDRDDRAQDRAFYNESWNGKTPFIVDRIGRGTIRVDALCLSILGGIQPGRLQPYLIGAIEQEEECDGLLPRFQLLVWPDAFGEWRPVDRYPDFGARNRACAIFERLANLEPLMIGAEPGEVGDPPFLRFSPDAQVLFIDWKREFENRIRSEQMEATPAFCQHMAKYRKLVPALALLFHLVEAVDSGIHGSVSLPALKLALAWADFLELHAKKLYAAELHRGAAAAQVLAVKIEEGTVKDGMTVRDLVRREWSGLRTSGRVYEAVDILQRLFWLRGEEIATGGRPSDVLRLHPDFRKEKV